jgi:holin-like protein
MSGLAKIFVYLVIGDLMARLSGLPIPGPVLGLAIMFADFAVQGQADAQVSAIFDRISAHFAVLFIPAGAGVIAYGATLGEVLPVVVIAVLGGTAVTMLVTAGGLALLLRRSDRRTWKAGAATTADGDRSAR